MLALLSRSRKSEGWVVYLLCCADGTFYCGSTTDIDRRMRQHKAGTGAKYTKARLPVSLIGLSATLPDRSTAQKLEALVKRAPKRNKLGVLEGKQGLARPTDTIVRSHP